MMRLDLSVYPDLEIPPGELNSLGDKADYIHRICSAWDFGIHPEQETFQLLADWRDVFDRFPVLTSPAYHAMRAWFGWNPIPYPRNVPAPLPRWVHLDRIEERGPDPCEAMI
jgi:hypothetical protein